MYNNYNNYNNNYNNNGFGRFINFFRGRYGFDLLSMILCLVSIGLNVGLRFLPGYWCLFSLTFVIPLVLVVLRAMSRDVQSRKRENDYVLNFFRKIASIVTFGKMKSGDKTHKYYSCPHCHTKLRVPKGKGKILITCTNCGYKFEKNTGKPKEAKQVKEPKVKAQKQKTKDDGYVYFPCPSCGANLRVPKGKGKITVRCTKCGNMFKKRT